ncbi:MAG: TenA family transcriptional regulator [Cyanophyceae cyanobacterium]
MPLTCQQLLQKYPQEWHDATVHPFLEQCQAGTIKPAQFNTWLVQDYLFVLEFTRFVGRVLASAMPEHFETLLVGLGALREELIWFRAKAEERSLNLAAHQQATCNKYCNYLEKVAQMPYAAQATALWAIELAYNQAWQSPKPMPDPYQEFSDRWGNPQFTDYVKMLEQQADEALAAQPEAEAEAVFRSIARLEKDFWQMAFAG